MKYPKIEAAVDDAVAAFIKNNGGSLIELLLESVIRPVPEHLPDIPVTKELILSEQTEVRNAD